MTNYFSKWIEAEAFTEVKDKQVISFIKRNIIYMFGILSEIICDNGSQFISNDAEGYCARWNITLKKSAPRTLKSNGQAESNRTTPKIAIGQTPFSLVFGVEVVIPSGVLVPTHRYGCMTEELNKAEMVRSLDTVDELRASAKVRLAA
ncbi:uncharacterized protein LOC141629893 [Silene latifolia]|uniref:uncharacterized protein LOC141629893 n=1 Tax=Silene latifolia TaxID=37657 RepID=UPI003D7844B2